MERVGGQVGGVRRRAARGRRAPRRSPSGVTLRGVAAPAAPSTSSTTALPAARGGGAAAASKPASATRSPSTRTETRIRSPQAAPPAAPECGAAGQRPEPRGAVRWSSSELRLRTAVRASITRHSRGREACGKVSPSLPLPVRELGLLLASVGVLRRPLTAKAWDCPSRTPIPVVLAQRWAGWRTSSGCADNLAPSRGGRGYRRRARRPACPSAALTSGRSWTPRSVSWRSSTGAGRAGQRVERRWRSSGRRSRRGSCRGRRAAPRSGRARTRCRRAAARRT